MKISELIDGISKRDLVLPEFQREYVWTREQAKQLMVSLIKGYPVGGLLFWKTDTPPELKNVDRLPEKFGNINVILDGQQRLTTLYTLLTGQIPPYYTENDIQTDPRDLFFNLDSQEFQYYQSSRMQGNSLWCSVVDCFNNKDINVFEIAKTFSTYEQQAFTLAQKYNANLNDLRNIKGLDFPVQTVPSHAKLDEAINIFDRVNSQGTKLTDAELALTHITGKWSEARRLLKDKIAELSVNQFYFDLTFLTRALTGIVTKRALFPTIHDRTKEQLEYGWKNLVKILDYMVAILPSKAFIHSNNDLNTTNVFIPLVVYLSMHNEKFPSDKILKHATYWLYAAQTWARYTSQTDQRLEFDVSLVVRDENPWNVLCDQIIDQRGRIEVKGNDLEGRGVQHPLFKMSLIIAKAHSAVDWFNGLPLGTIKTKSYNIHYHHIFPQSILYNNGYDPDNHLHRKIVNEIANRAFLTNITNLELSNKAPEEYLPAVEENYPGALTRQFIPMDPNLWKIDRFSDFLEARRELIAKKINEFMSALISEPIVAKEKSISELISLGESATLEFKSTLQWDVVQKRQNKELRHSVLKTINAFLNSNGGILIIGIEDDGNVLGLELDLSLVQNSTDKFAQLINSLIYESLGPEFSSLIKIRFEKLNGNSICVVETDKSPESAFLKTARGKEFYIRLGNTTRLLDSEETHNYIQMNWDNTY